MSDIIIPEDMQRLAAQISDHYGSAFSPSELVNYGETVIVKPGARTKAGHLVTGSGVARAISANADVYPLAVTYGQAPDVDEAPEAFEQAMMAELDAAEADVDSSSSMETFGYDSFFDEQTPMRMPRYAVRMRRRYDRISRRFGRFAVKAVAYQRSRGRRVSARVYRRIQRLWNRMLRRGVPTDGLYSPARIRAMVYAQAKSLAQSTSAVTPPPGQAGFPMAPAPAVPLAYNQRALEQSVGLRTTGNLLTQQISSTSFGAEDSLHADCRAETLGYLFGSIEHDYYGLVDEPFEIVMDESDAELMEGPSGSSNQGLDAEIDEVLDGDLDDDLEDLPEDDSDLDLPEDDSDLEEDLDEDADLDEDIPEDDSDLEEDDAPSSEVSTRRAVDDVVKDAAKDVEAIIMEVKKVVAVPASEAHAKNLSKARTKLNEKLSKLEPGAIQANVERSAESVSKVVQDAKSLAQKVQELDVALKESSPNGSINYGALIPAGSSSNRKIVVIAIKKNKDGQMDSDRKAISDKAARMGLDSDGHLADMIGMDLISSMAQGFTPAEAYYVLDQATEPMDFMGSDYKPVSLSELSNMPRSKYAKAARTLKVKWKMWKAKPKGQRKAFYSSTVKPAADELNAIWNSLHPIQQKRKYRFPGPNAVVKQIQNQLGIKKSHFSGAVRHGSMNGMQALEVFGAYVEGFNAEPEELFTDDEFGQDEFGRMRPLFRNKPARYKMMTKRYERFKEAGNQKLAARILGRMKNVWSKMNEDQREGLTPPEAIPVPGVEIAKQISPAAAQVNDQVESQSAQNSEQAEQAQRAESVSPGVVAQRSSGAKLGADLDEMDDLDLDEDFDLLGAEFGRRKKKRKSKKRSAPSRSKLFASRSKYARNVKQFMRRIRKGNTKGAARDWKALTRVWSKMSSKRRMGLSSPSKVLKSAAKISAPATSIATGKSMKAVARSVGKPAPQSEAAPESMEDTSMEDASMEDVSMEDDSMEDDSEAMGLDDLDDDPPRRLRSPRFGLDDDLDDDFGLDDDDLDDDFGLDDDFDDDFGLDDDLDDDFGLDDDFDDDLDDDLDEEEDEDELDALTDQYMARYSGSASMFPAGSSAPFPPPRMAGREVY